jgi:hypothetical protein
VPRPGCIGSEVELTASQAFAASSYYDKGLITAGLSRSTITEGQIAWCRERDVE